MPRTGSTGLRSRSPTRSSSRRRGAAAMDEAFVPLHQIVAALQPGGEIRDDDAGVRTYIRRVEIESPVELDVTRDDDGLLRIGSTPPLYYVDTSLRPAYHRLRFTAELDEEPQ